MNAARSFAVIALMSILALSGTQVSFGQAPASADPPVQVPQPAAPAPPPQPVPAAAPQPLPAAPAQPLPAAPDAAAAAPAAAPQPAPAAAAPAPETAVPVAGVPTLSLIRGSHIIGSRAILAGGIVLGTVQDLLSVAGSGEYVLVANPSGFVTIPRGLTTFVPASRTLLVNMTFAQVAELPRLLRLAQLNRLFLQRVHTFFGTQRGLAILRDGAGRNARFTRTPGGERRPETRPPGGERRAETRPPGGAERRADTRTAAKPVTRPQTRNEPRAENGTEPRR
ncbi:MAG TPA: hypothetical protein VEI07_09285 [Planctomycetaceae bacterium]|nr:hypothetical protein [Planctomycetaceae bacterium]